MGLGTGFQPADIADISSLETASPVTQSIGFQPKPWLSNRDTMTNQSIGFQPNL